MGKNIKYLRLWFDGDLLTKIKKIMFVTDNSIDNISKMHTNGFTGSHIKKV